MSTGAVTLIHLQEELQQMNEREANEEAILKAIHDKKNAMVHSLWQINVVDIESTLSLVCDGVSSETSLLNYPIYLKHIFARAAYLELHDKFEHVQFQFLHNRLLLTKPYHQLLHALLF